MKSAWFGARHKLMWRRIFKTWKTEVWENQLFLTVTFKLIFDVPLFINLFSLTELKRTSIKHQSVYPKCHFVFLINWNMELEIKFWFLFLYWSWDRKHQNKWFSDFQNSWTLKFKFKVCFSFFILIWKTKNQIYLNKCLMKLVTIPLTQS